MRVARTGELDGATLEALRRINEEAHGHRFTDDWEHALGGVHFFVEEDGEPVAHASVVERPIETAGRTLRTGYVEAVATRPDRQRRGLGAAVVQAATEHIAERFELGALSTGEHGLYARFGWETWRGPTFVRIGIDIERTPREDGGIMILRTPRTPAGIDVADRIVCDWRAGDVW